MASITELWNEFNTELLKFIKSRVNKQQDAEDILQDVYVKIFKKIGTLQKKSEVKSWIYQISRNAIIDFYRKKKDLPVSPDNLSLVDDKSDTEENMNSDIAECLTHMLFDLPEKYREVYDLYENQNMKHKEIVDKLNISESTSKMRLLRAKELFKQNLQNCCHFEVDPFGNIINYHPKKDGIC